MKNFKGSTYRKNIMLLLNSDFTNIILQDSLGCNLVLKYEDYYYYIKTSGANYDIKKLSLNDCYEILLGGHIYFSEFRRDFTDDLLNIIKKFNRVEKIDELLKIRN